MQIHSYNVGFIDIPGLITLNIYTIGCKHNCPGCHTKHLQDFNYPHRQVLTEERLDSILDSSIDLINGVCWLGGDPLEQSEILYKYSVKIKDKKLMNILFTGYLFEEVQPKIKEVCDIIVDGKFNGYPITDLNTNQKIWFKQNNDIFSIFTYQSIKKEFIK